ncbi:MAG: DUF5666 domain-containing protein [Candidatus Omnitrophica bacterium]|nr:DUF5666 domain-containing protein [Candidatus Omnitrophota bacterium]MDD5771174.1 DUF5666 domain-containing protein [Candidatus Omnitrophota bacterium]
MKIWLCLYALIGLLVAPEWGFCQYEQEDPQRYSREGVVTEVDSVGSLLVIFDGMEQTRFSVDSGARIQRGTENIMLDDLESNDTVTVEYYKSPDGALKATSIVDNNIISDF